MTIRSLVDLDLAVFDRLVTDPSPEQDGVDRRKIDSSFCQTLDVPVVWLFRELREDLLTSYPLITMFRRGMTQLTIPFARTDTILETIGPGVVRRREGPVWFTLDYQISFQSRNWEEFQAINWNLMWQVFEYAAGVRFIDIDGISRQLLLATANDRHNREAQYYSRDLVFGLTLPLFPLQSAEPGATQETIEQVNVNTVWSICDPLILKTTADEETWEFPFDE